MVLLVVPVTIRVENQEHQASAQGERNHSAQGHGEEAMQADGDVAHAPPEVETGDDAGEQQNPEQGKDEDGSQCLIPAGGRSLTAERRAAKGRQGWPRRSGGVQRFSRLIMGLRQGLRRRAAGVKFQRTFPLPFWAGTL